MGHWQLSDIPWNRFRKDLVDPDLVQLTKTASLVEYNSADYADYLCNVFSEDREFQRAARRWAEEEIRHGLALKEWSQMADPAFDFDISLCRFVNSYRVPVDSHESVRGSRARELVARCVIESGTNSYYSALGDVAREPVLKEICHHIASDEARHFRLFLDYLKRYLVEEKLSVWDRVRTALGRCAEVEDEELAMAYAAANFNASPDPARTKEYVAEYFRRAYRVYRPRHLQRGMSLLCTASGLGASSLVAKLSGNMAYAFLRLRTRMFRLRSGSMVGGVAPRFPIRAAPRNF